MKNSTFVSNRVYRIFLFIAFTSILFFNCTKEKKQMKTGDKPGQTNTSFVKVVDEQDFPEGPAWDGQNFWYVSNCNGGWITRIGKNGPGEFLRANDDPFTLEKTNGLTVYKDGSIFACDFGKGAILKISSGGKTEIYTAEFDGKRFNRPNDLAFDPEGNLYFTDPNQYDPENRDGAVYRVEKGTRTVTRVASDLAFPNGLAFSSDGNHLYLCESALHRILKFTVSSDGGLTEPVTFAQMPGGDPDGCNFDRQGNLYVAHFGGGAIYVFAPDGSLKQKILTPGKKPSNVEFGDKDLRTLFITEDETNAVYKMRVEIPGLPLFCSPGRQ